MTDEEKQKELVTIIEGMRVEGAKLESMGQKAVEAGRLTQDVAPAMAKIYATIPASSLPSSEWDDQITNWKNFQDGVSRFYSIIPAISGMTMSSVNSAYTTASICCNKLPTNLPQPAVAAFQK